MKRSRFSIWVIAIAAVILVGAIGFAIWRSSSPEASPPQPSASTSASPSAPSSFVPSTAPASSPGLSVPVVSSSPVQPSESPLSADQIPLPKDRIIDFVKELNGSAYIRELEVGTDNLEIFYYKDYAEFKQARPDTKLTTADYASVFHSPDAVHQVLMEQSALLFYKFPGIASLDISLPFSGTIYTVSLTKGSIEKFYNTNFDQIQSDAEWKEQISSRYFTKSSRDAFAKRFIRTS
ncbi:hypothetical protein KIH86_27355 [Paenibacillus sp. HN-1]|uniref:hypothetical protein n=1 Tax=Paenibacillus TaxID=44249 RepID=UPI001CA92164|nr:MULTISPECIES: hypothetical protein [Paenibacillus]MBY9078422.1 hypothetical protein [Paenibacillus sp. CGMCC 1.18879]MBY9087912.1 hypothetical protein [Paenibacillus sinensis]